MSTDYSLLHVYTQRGGKNGASITFRFYTDPPNIAGGGGGWQAVQRPQNSASTAWRGPDAAYTMELNLIMDTWAGSGDVEADCRTLEKFSGTLVSPVTQPPLLVLDANGALQNDYYNFPALLWVISDPPVYGEVLRVKGRRVRQVVTVKFMHYVAFDELTRSKNLASQNDHAHRFQTTLSIDTFRKAAAKYAPMRDAKWGTRLAMLNNKRDATAKLLPGRWYRLPTQAQFDDWKKTSRR